MSVTQVEQLALLNEALNVEGSVSKIFSRFYNYSYGNQMHFLCQGIKEPVATFKKWGEMGRRINKGSRKYEVIKPIPIYDKDDPDNSFTIFKPIKSVFKLSDTYGEELPKATETEKWSAIMACNNLDIAIVGFEMTNGNVQGYASKNEIAINPVAEYPLETFAHEIAHVVLGHTDTKVSDSKTLERDIKEFQAEAVSFILMNESEAVDGKDWDRSGARGYIQHWLKEKKPTNKDIKPIFSAVNTILKAGREQVA